MTLLQLVHAQRTMMDLKGTAGHEEQKKIVEEMKMRLLESTQQSA